MQVEFQKPELDREESKYSQGEDIKLESLSPLAKQIIEFIKQYGDDPEKMSQFETSVLDERNQEVKGAIEEVWEYLQERMKQKQQSQGKTQRASEKIKQVSIDVCTICGRGRESCGGYWLHGDSWPYMREIIL